MQQESHVSAAPSGFKCYEKSVLRAEPRFVKFCSNISSQVTWVITAGLCCMQGCCQTGVGLAGSEREQRALCGLGLCQRRSAVWADASL